MSRRRVAIVFDLTPDMLFRLTDGTTVTLAELERMVRLAPDVTGYAPWDRNRGQPNGYWPTCRPTGWRCTT